jgi:hypothetical protein
VTTRLHESEPPESRDTIFAHADDWNRQFIKHFEMHLVDASKNLSADTTDSELQMTAIRAILETLIDSGMESESALELLGQVAIERKPVNVAWSDALNQRRFALIDKEIQGMLTLAESIELAGLTRIMRNHFESETNLPMKGARDLHRKLLGLESTGDSD